MRRNHYCNAMLLSNPVLGGLSYSPVVEKKRGVERGEWREGVSGACPSLLVGVVSRESLIVSGITRNLGWILVDRRHNKELANRKHPASCYFHYSPLATSHFPLAATSTNKLGASPIHDSRFPIDDSRFPIHDSQFPRSPIHRHPSVHHKRNRVISPNIKKFLVRQILYIHKQLDVFSEFVFGISIQY